VDAQQRLLREVFAQLPVAEMPVKEPDQRRLMALNQFRKGLPVTPLQPQHQLVVFVVHESTLIWRGKEKQDRDRNNFP